MGILTRQIRDLHSSEAPKNLDALAERSYEILVKEREVAGEDPPNTWEAPISIGRDPNSDIRILNIKDPTSKRVSRYHAAIFRSPHDKGFVLVDIGSTRGTFVKPRGGGGLYLQDRSIHLRNGDTIYLGREGPGAYALFYEEDAGIVPGNLNPFDEEATFDPENDKTASVFFRRIVEDRSVVKKGPQSKPEKRRFEMETR